MVRPGNLISKLQAAGTEQVGRPTLPASEFRLDPAIKRSKEARK